MREQDFSFAMVPLERITVRDRSRQDMGDLDGLTLSVKEVGLLNPVTVTADFHLIAGQRRLEACRRLGWDEIPAHVVHHIATDSVVSVLAEVHENDLRKGFTTSERNIATARRIALAAKLREEGHSLRSIASTVGVSEGQVRKDLASEQVRTGTHLAPEKITGADGKSYPATRPEIVPGGADDSDAPDLDEEAAAVASTEVCTAPGTTIDTETGEVMPVDEPTPAEPEFDELASKLAEVMDTPARRDNQYLLAVMNAIVAVRDRLIVFDPTEVAERSDALVWESLDRLDDSLTRWFSTLKAARPRALKAVK